MTDCKHTHEEGRHFFFTLHTSKQDLLHSNFLSNCVDNLLECSHLGPGNNKHRQKHKMKNPFFIIDNCFPFKMKMLEVLNHVVYFSFTMHIYVRQ